MNDAAVLAGLPTGGDWEFRIWFLDDEAMAEAHVDIMNVEGTTDVITMAYLEEPEALFPGDMGLELLVCVPFAEREGAERQDSSFADELMLYIVHVIIRGGLIQIDIFLIVPFVTVKSFAKPRCKSRRFIPYIKVGNITKFAHTEDGLSASSLLCHDTGHAGGSRAGMMPQNHGRDVHQVT